MLNYFELMSLPQRFDIDMIQLQQQLRLLQSQFHPDANYSPMPNQVGNDHQSASYTTAQTMTNPSVLAELSKLKPAQISAIINEGYHTLKNLDTRAAHLLALQEISQSINSPIRDLDFLDDAMSFRIELDDANLTTLPELKQQLTNWLEHIAAEFRHTYQLIVNPESTDFDQQTIINRALIAVQKLQFLVKLQADVDKKHDELAGADYEDNQDDDLYV